MTVGYLIRACVHETNCMGVGGDARGDGLK